MSTAILQAECLGLAAALETDTAPNALETIRRGRIVDALRAAAAELQRLEPVSRALDQANAYGLTITELRLQGSVGDLSAEAGSYRVEPRPMDPARLFERAVRSLCCHLVGARRGGAS